MLPWYVVSAGILLGGVFGNYICRLIIKNKKKHDKFKPIDEKCDRMIYTFGGAGAVGGGLICGVGEGLTYGIGGIFAGAFIGIIAGAIAGFIVLNVLWLICILIT